jgi:hypothetical protein
MAKKKKNLHGLDKYVIFSISCMVLYTIVSQIIQTTTGYTNDVLTTCFFGFFGGEIVTCALIKIFKLTKTKKLLQEYNWDHPTINKEETEEESYG